MDHHVKDQVVRYLDRSQLPNEVEPLKDMVVTLSQALLKLWEEIDTLKAENAILRAENALLREENAQLRAENAQLREENAVLRAENAALKVQNELLMEEVKLLKQKVFGRKKFPAQKKSVENSLQPSVNQNRKKPTGRKPFSETLPREDHLHDLTPLQKVCPYCQAQLKLMGEETSEQLELVRASLKVINHRRLKYACSKCSQGVVVAPAPYKPIEKGLAGPTLISHIIVGKISDHVPLYRQEKILGRYGMNLNRSTLCYWVQEIAKSLTPLYEEMKKELVGTDHIYADETPLLTLRVIAAALEQKVTAEKRQETRIEEGKSARRGYIWVYGREGSHGRKPLVVYDFSLGRSGKHTQKFLENFKGFLQTDAYSGYRCTQQKRSEGQEVEVIAVGCWAHVLRKFEEAMIGNPHSPATEILSWIRKLYAIEKEAKEKGLDAQTVKALRKENAEPILKEIKRWLETFACKALPKGLLGRAISYARNNWEALIVYIEDGRLGIDNNFSERNIKLAVMGRKNYLFAGSEGGGKSLAILYSLIQTCELNGVNPEDYLADVMIRIQHHPMSKIHELLPHYWKPPNQQEQAQAA